MAAHTITNDQLMQVPCPFCEKLIFVTVKKEPLARRTLITLRSVKG